MKMLLVVLIVLINYNEFSYQLPQLTVNVGDIDVHVHAGGEMESHHGEEGHHGLEDHHHGLEDHHHGLEDHHHGLELDQYGKEKPDILCGLKCKIYHCDSEEGCVKQCAKDEHFGQKCMEKSGKFNLSII